MSAVNRSFNYLNLDQATRAHMLAEFDAALEKPDGVYYSKRFSEAGREQYPTFMRRSIRDGNEVGLAEALVESGCMESGELRLGRPVAVPYTAAQTYADGEFNRYYARAVCLRAFDHGSNEVVVYRAKVVDKPRPESEALIGERLPASTLLDDLRVHIGVELALGLSKPNSGLSIHCGCGNCGPLPVSH